MLFACRVFFLPFFHCTTPLVRLGTVGGVRGGTRIASDFRNFFRIRSAIMHGSKHGVFVHW